MELLVGGPLEGFPCPPSFIPAAIAANWPSIRGIGIKWTKARCRVNSSMLSFNSTPQMWHFRRFSRPFFVTIDVEVWSPAMVVLTEVETAVQLDVTVVIVAVLLTAVLVLKSRHPLSSLFLFCETPRNGGLELEAYVATEVGERVLGVLEVVAAEVVVLDVPADSVAVELAGLRTSWVWISSTLN